MVEIKKQIKELAKTADIEICGFVVNGLVFSCENISPNPTKNFTISPADYIKVARQGRIQFVYHSHLSEKDEFSEFDKTNLYNHKLDGLLYCKGKDSFKTFFYNSYNNKYTGRVFEIGKHDCFSLVRDYYKNELNIHIKDYPRGKDWYKNNPNIINENFVNCGFEKVETIKRHDIIVFDILNNGNPCHFGIYLENDTMLIHPRNKLSTIESLSNAYKQKIAYILRPC